MKRRNGPRLEQAIDARLQELRDVARSGVTERTGKAGYIHSTGERQRRIGGMRSSFPELSRLPDRDTPAKIAQAMERGKGVVYRRIRAAVGRELEPYIREAKTHRERPSVMPHPGNKKCSKCGKMHGKGEHRFHGAGAFHRTHAFAFNPRRTRGRRLSNPRGVVIYGQALRITAKKTQPHVCDAACKRANHSYFHDFKPGAVIYGMPDGSLKISRS